MQKHTNCHTTSIREVPHLFGPLMTTHLYKVRALLEHLSPTHFDNEILEETVYFDMRISGIALKE